MSFIVNDKRRFDKLGNLKPEFVEPPPPPLPKLTIGEVLESMEQIRKWALPLPNFCANCHHFHSMSIDLKAGSWHVNSGCYHRNKFIDNFSNKSHCQCFSFVQEDCVESSLKLSCFILENSGLDMSDEAEPAMRSTIEAYRDAMEEEYIIVPYRRVVCGVVDSVEHLPRYAARGDVYFVRKNIGNRYMYWHASSTHLDIVTGWHPEGADQTGWAYTLM